MDTEQLTDLNGITCGIWFGLPLQEDPIGTNVRAPFPIVLRSLSISITHAFQLNSLFTLAIRSRQIECEKIDRFNCSCSIYESIFALLGAPVWTPSTANGL